MSEKVAFELRKDVADEFSGGSVNAGDGKSVDLAEALEEGKGKIILGPHPKTVEIPDFGDDVPTDERAKVRAKAAEKQEAENLRADRDRQVADALDNHPALKRVGAKDNEPTEAVASEPVDTAPPEPPAPEKTAEKPAAASKKK